MLLDASYLPVARAPSLGAAGCVLGRCMSANSLWIDVSGSHSSLGRNRAVGREGCVELRVAKVRTPDFSLSVGTQPIEIDITGNYPG
jgi:hypothetical protein